MQQLIIISLNPFRLTPKIDCNHYYSANSLRCYTCNLLIMQPKIFGCFQGGNNAPYFSKRGLNLLQLLISSSSQNKYFETTFFIPSFKINSNLTQTHYPQLGFKSFKSGEQGEIVWQNCLFINGCKIQNFNIEGLEKQF